MDLGAGARITDYVLVLLQDSKEWVYFADINGN